METQTIPVRTMSGTDTLSSLEGSESAARSLSQRLNYMKGHTPSISAIALKGDEKVVLLYMAHCVYNDTFFSSWLRNSSLKQWIWRESCHQETQTPLSFT